MYPHAEAGHLCFLLSEAAAELLRKGGGVGRVHAWAGRLPPGAASRMQGAESCPYRWLLTPASIHSHVAYGA